MSYIGSSARPGDLYDEDNECIRCHKSTLTDDGTDPTDLCHNCAHERVEELEAQVQTLREALTKPVSDEEWEYFVHHCKADDWIAAMNELLSRRAALAATEPKETK